MTKIDIFSGFLGAGKTTLIKKLIAEAYQGEKLVLIENEFGEIGIDGGFLQETGIQVNEMNAGCICCSLVGNFYRALNQVVQEYAPDRILIEPSGIGMLSDVVRAVAEIDGIEINSTTTVADATKCKRYMRVFREFYGDQITHAGAIVLSRTAGLDKEKLEESLAVLRECNAEATIITTPWDELDGKQILEVIEHTDTLAKELEHLLEDDDDDDDEECDDPNCECHHHHDDDDDEHEHHHHHHHHHHDDDDDEECDDPDCECHHHHDDDDDEHEHHHHHHHHHHHTAGDEVFASWGIETAKKFTEDEIKNILAALDDAEKYGSVLRAKGIVDSADGQWIHFDHVPGEADVRRDGAGVTGRLCVIGSGIKEDALKELFGV